MQNKLIDLNNHLFAQLERLSNEDLTEKQLQKEIARTDAITNVSKEVVANASLVLSAVKLKAQHKGLMQDDIPKGLLGVTSE